MADPQRLTVQQAISQAKKAAKQGKIRVAAEIYTTVLQHQPDHPFAKKALRKLQKELADNQPLNTDALDPPQDQRDALVNLYHSGQISKAEQACRELLEAYPHSIIVLNVQAVLLTIARKFHDALEIFDKILQINPSYAEGYGNRGIVLKELKQLEQAIESYDTAIQLNPNYARAYNNRGNALKQLGRMEEAAQSIDKAIQINPDLADAYVSRGAIRKDLGSPEQAIVDYDKAIQLKPDCAEAHTNYGNALTALGKYNEAVDSHNKALQFQPGYAEAHNNLGIVLIELGNLDEAEKCFKQTILLRPDLAQAHSNLCEIYDKQNMVAELTRTLNQAQEVLPKNDSSILYRMGQLAIREKRNEDALELLELVTPEKLAEGEKFGHSVLLATLYDKLGDFPGAFAQFEISNEISASSVEAKKFSGQRYLNRISELSKSFTSADKIKWSVNRLQTSQQSLAFLIGFPRSGTTLLDTILRSHPKVLMVEEKPILAAVESRLGSIATENLLTSLDDHQLVDLRKIYFQELQSHIEINSSQELIIDKLPLNIVEVGLIHRVFPDSKFILALRHPYDCVLSCFMQAFELNDAMANFLTLQQSAELYNAVMGLWVNYTNVLDLEVSKVKYEDLVQNLKGTAEPLLNFLGLSWHDNLLNYQQTAISRNISTPSYNQVTQGLYTQSINRWKNYDDQINGIVPLLEPWIDEFGYSS